MDELIATLTNATPEQYFLALVVLFGVIWFLSVLGFQPKPVYRLYYKRPRFPRLWNTAAWLFIGALALSVYEFSSTGQVRWIENGFTRLTSAVESLPEAEQTLSSSLNGAKDTLESAFEKAEQATAEAFESGTTRRSGDIPAGAISAKVTYVTDGDTVKVDTEQGALTLRFQGIDAPERDQRYGKTSTRELKALLTDTIYLDIEGTDRYDRTIATLYRDDGVNINASMVCGGHAWWYERYAPSDRELASCQGYAIENKLGLWKGYDPIPPWEWRRGVRKP